MLTSLNKIYEKLEQISLVVTKFTSEKTESNRYESDISRRDFQASGSNDSSPNKRQKSLVRNDTTDSRHIFTQNNTKVSTRSSNSSIDQALPNSPSSVSFKEREGFLKEFKAEFEKHFDECIPAINRMDKFQNLEKSFAQAIKRLKGNLELLISFLL